MVAWWLKWEEVRGHDSWQLVKTCIWRDFPVTVFHHFGWVGTLKAAAGAVRKTECSRQQGTPLGGAGLRVKVS
jgi:hypothetical protein